MARSGKRRITVHRFPTTEPIKFIKVSVGYEDGGVNYFDNRNSARGFYMHFTPIETEEYQGSTIEKTLLFHGRKALISEAKRYSEKRILMLADQVRIECERRDPHIMRIVNVVLAEENLTLVEQPMEVA